MSKLVVLLECIHIALIAALSPQIIFDIPSDSYSGWTTYGSPGISTNSNSCPNGPNNDCFRLNCNGDDECGGNPDRIEISIGDTIKFHHIQLQFDARGNSVNRFRAFYKVGSGSWTTLWDSYFDRTFDRHFSLDMDNADNYGSNVYIGFENSDYGDSCYIDRIQVFGTPITLSPTNKPSINPTINPSGNPTINPTKSTNNPTINPTKSTKSPSINPTKVTYNPSTNPTKSTNNPSITPTKIPTLTPTLSPTKSTFSPTKYPSTLPTLYPTWLPTNSPTINPSRTTNQPSSNPTGIPTKSPSITPTESPTNNPSKTPSLNPTNNPSSIPTTSPSKSPTDTPTDIPTTTPTSIPSFTPTIIPTYNPSFIPTLTPSDIPTLTPSDIPTNAPSLIPTDSPTIPSDANIDDNNTFKVSKQHFVITLLGILGCCICLSLICFILIAQKQREMNKIINNATLNESGLESPLLMIDNSMEMHNLIKSDTAAKNGENMNSISGRASPNEVINDTLGGKALGERGLNKNSVSLAADDDFQNDEGTHVTQADNWLHYRNIKKQNQKQPKVTSKAPDITEIEINELLDNIDNNQDPIKPDKNNDDNIPKPDNTQIRDATITDGIDMLSMEAAQVNIGDNNNDILICNDDVNDATIDEARNNDNNSDNDVSIGMTIQ